MKKTFNLNLSCDTTNFFKEIPFEEINLINTKDSNDNSESAAGISLNKKSLRQIDWSFCPENKISNTNSQLSSKHELINANSTQINVNADRVSVYEQNTAILSGDVQLFRQGEFLQAPWLIYDLDLEIAQAQHGLYYQRGGINLLGEEGIFDLQYNRGILNNARYQINTRHARGTAANIYIDDLNHTRLNNATYSTCPHGRDDWLLNAKTLDLNQTTGRGIGQQVIASFKDIPFFYLPYISFPISGKRESGFLIPSVGTSSRSGLDLRIPYYWNIAPNKDLTLTNRLISKRGLQFNTEFRYLTSRSKGDINFEYLPNDKVYGKERNLFTLHHNEKINRRVNSAIVFNAVSDNSYFHDLGNNLTLASLSYLERRADVIYNDDRWSMLGRVQAFQTIDNTRPFQRLPQLQINFDSPAQNTRSNYHIISELSNFYRSPIAQGITNNQNYTGGRLWVKPTFTYSINKLGGFFKPQLSLHHVNYNIKDIAHELPPAPQLTLPIFSVDTGLFLERQFSDTITQTLEPRIYYLYVPYKNQKNLPIFDTTLLDFNFSQLFRENRFSGPDRLGDANQITAALTSRFIKNKTGKQLFYGSLGQIHYFRNRIVNLDYGSNVNLLNDVSTSSRSDVIAEIGAYFGKFWTASSAMQWNQQRGQPEKRSINLRYQSDHNHLLNFSFRNRRDLLEQTDLFIKWPLSRHWRAVGRWNYSLKDNQPLEAFAGLRYDSCCWALQVVGRRYVNLPGEDPKSDIMLQLELKGLANIGQEPLEIHESSGF